MIDHSLLRALVLPLALALAFPASAQRAPAVTVPATSGDYIVALVDGEPITNHEVRQRLSEVRERVRQSGQTAPAVQSLLLQVVDQLIAERAAVIAARGQGARVDDESLRQAELQLAAQNGLSVEAFRERLRGQGVDPNRLRSELRDQILLQRLREREVQNRVRVSDAEVQAYLQQEQARAPQDLALNLGHLLVAVPERATAQQLQALQARAQSLAQQARSGADFAQLARQHSEGAERAQGGAMGLRPVERLPELFVQAARELPVGGVAGPLRSPAGFHVLKVLERQATPQALSVAETRVRHILLRAGTPAAQTQAVQRLQTWRTQMLSGKAEFERLAREHSQDGTAPQGGDLGWVRPGVLVPEFEQAMNALTPGDLSEPLVSRFGVHLIRVDARRRVALSPEEAREAARDVLREGKAEQAVSDWLAEVRSRAFVELREPATP